jgi:monoamine oxidase
MARTPLMYALQRFTSECTEAFERGVEVEQVRNERETHISRRTLLKGAGAIAAGAVLAGSPLSNLIGSRLTASAASKPRIAIVGAGIAGMNAALTLHDAGLPTTVYEASSRIGGRMHSNTTTWADGQKSEWCGEFINSDHTFIRNLVARFNLTTLDRNKSAIPGSAETYWFDQKYYLAKQSVIDFKPVYEIMKQQLHDAGYPTLYNRYKKTGYFLDHLSLYDWIENYVPGGHSSNFGQLLDVAYIGELGLDTRVQSSLNILYELGFQPKRGGFSITGTNDERYSILTGNQRLPEAIASSLPSGTVKINWALTAIVRNSDETITLTFSTPHGMQQATFDHVILAIPFTVLRMLDFSKARFDTLKQTAITQLGYGTNSKLKLQFDSRYWNQKGPWPGIASGDIYTDLEFESSWDTTLGQEGKAGIIVNFTGGTVGASYRPSQPYSTSKDSAQVRHYAEKLLPQLEQVWPGVTPYYTGTAALSYPTGDPNLLGSYSCWTIGQYTLFAGYERVQQGNIHFAGEHTSVNHQGYMEGGARTGATAAYEIIKAYVTA